MDITKDMRYIGACSLLGRLSNAKMNADDLYSIKRALDDCVATFPGRLEVVATSSSGYSLEPILNQTNTGEMPS